MDFSHAKHGLYSNAMDNTILIQSFACVMVRKGNSNMDNLL